ncbi:MAG: hypothetical protein JRJ85_26005, partial [Deltaproteobacteria bacterium]|nr:hypothetical protein [Deltaproteobacteria bacterium]
MTIYYVRASMGNDSDDGETPAAAFLTVDKAANTVAAGDIVWIGGGVYRETVTIDTSGTSGTPIEWHADVDGAQTGDAGLVVITKLVDEFGTGGSGEVLKLDGKEYNEFYNIVFGPAGSGAADRTVEGVTGNANYQGILFDTCSFLQPQFAGYESVAFDYNVGAAITGTPLTFRNCYIQGEVLIAHGAFTADIACAPTFENCIIIGGSGHALNINGPSIDPGFGMTGYAIKNCTIIGSANAVYSTYQRPAAGSVGRIDNCLFPVMSSAIPIYILLSETWDGDYNVTVNPTLSSGFTDGGHSIDDAGVILGMVVEPILRNVYGSTPYLPYEQVHDHLGSGYKSGGIDVGGATYAPSTDIYGNARPMGRTLDDAGAVETRRRPEKEETTVKTGSLAAAFKGAGYHDITLPVAATSTTVSVYARYDSNHTG